MKQNNLNGDKKMNKHKKTIKAFEDYKGDGDLFTGYVLEVAEIDALEAIGIESHSEIAGLSDGLKEEFYSLVYSGINNMVETPEEYGFYDSYNTEDVCKACELWSELISS